MTKITGTNLVSTYEQMLAEGKTKSEIVRACGYTSIKSDGTERLHFTDFYTEILNAKGLEMVTDDEEEEVEETLYDELCEEYSQDAVDAFIECFGDNDLEGFRDSYYGEYDSEKEFAEQFYDEMGYQIPAGLCIDWEATWDCYLRGDFYYENGFVFRSTWWENPGAA